MNHNFVSHFCIFGSKNWDDIHLMACTLIYQLCTSTRLTELEVSSSADHRDELAFHVCSLPEISLLVTKRFHYLSTSCRT